MKIKNIFKIIALTTFTACISSQALAGTTPAPSAVVKQPAPIAQTLPVEAAKPNAKFTPEQVTDIQKVIYDYLLSNPQILREMSKALRAQEMNNMQAETKQQIPSYIKDLYNTDTRFAIGNPKGDVVLVEIFDYQCGHCKNVNETMHKIVKDDNKLQVIFLEWPIFGQDSVNAVKAAFAAQKQGKYLEMHDALLATENPLNADKIKQLVKTVGLDEAKFNKDMADKDLDSMVKANIQLAQNLKLPATPAFIIGNRQGSKFEFILGESSETELLKAVADVRK